MIEIDLSSNLQLVLHQLEEKGHQLKNLSLLV